MRNALTAALLLTLSALTSAQPASYAAWDFSSPYKDKCSNGSMMEMNECLAEARGDTEHRMDVAYRKLLSSLINPAPLRKSQQAWLRYREAQCKFEVPPEWTGSAIPYSRNSCLIDHTERRVRDLERVAPCNGCAEFKPEFYKCARQQHIMAAAPNHSFKRTCLRHAA